MRKLAIHILEDEAIEAYAAIAGLIPLHEKNPPESAAFRGDRCIELFDITYSTTIDMAVEFLKTSSADIYIIDINLPPPHSSELRLNNITNGLEFYRYMERTGIAGQKILFTKESHNATYMINITNAERGNKVEKSIGQGYEILAANINRYLYRAAQSVIAKCNPADINRILSLVESKKKIEKILDEQLQLQGDLISLRSVMAYENRIEQIGREPVIVNKASRQEVLKLLTPYHKLTEELKDRGIFKSAGMRDFLNGFSKISKEYEPIISSQVKYIVKQILLNINVNKYQMKLDKHVHFGIIHFANYGRFNEEDFFKHFLNAMAVRRVLILFDEIFTENVDRGHMKCKSKYEKLYGELANEVIRTLRRSEKKYESKSLIQQMRNLNLGIDKTFGREKILHENYNKFDFEQEWFASEELDSYRKELISQILE